MHRKNHSKYPVSSHSHMIELSVVEYQAMADELNRLRKENAELKAGKAKEMIAHNK